MALKKSGCLLFDSLFYSIRSYDADRLRRNTVPVVAAIYAEDMYVPPALSERTAAAISNLRPWITNEYEHSGLRDDERVFTRLVAMQRDVV